MEPIKEIWVPIKEFEGSYEVSNNGDVRGLTRRIRRANSRGGEGTVSHSDSPPSVPNQRNDPPADDDIPF